MLQIHREAGLDELFLYPYTVLPNRSAGSSGSGPGLMGGVIECVPNARTRHDIGKYAGAGAWVVFLYVRMSSYVCNLE